MFADFIVEDSIYFQETSSHITDIQIEREHTDATCQLRRDGIIEEPADMWERQDDIARFLDRLYLTRLRLSNSASPPPPMS